jgi:hypothetical protein
MAIGKRSVSCVDDTSMTAASGLLLSRRHTTSYRPSLHTRRAPYLTPLLAICAPCLTPDHSGGLSFCFFSWYYRQHGGGHGQRQCCSC